MSAVTTTFRRLSGARYGGWKYRAVVKVDGVEAWACEHEHAFAKSTLAYSGGKSATQCAKDHVRTLLSSGLAPDA